MVSFMLVQATVLNETFATELTNEGSVFDWDCDRIVSLNKEN